MSLRQSVQNLEPKGNYEGQNVALCQLNTGYIEPL